MSYIYSTINILFSAATALVLLVGEPGPCRAAPATRIALWHVMGGPLKTTLDTLIAGFQRQQPGVEVAAVSMGNYTALSQKLMASASAGNEPELSQSYEAWTSQLIEKGAVMPFGDFIDGPEGLDSADRADLYPVMLDECSRQGKLYSLPFNKSVPVYYYNKELFARAGLDPERFPATWGEFLDAAKCLTVDRDGDGQPEQWGTAFPAASLWMFQCLILQNGGDLFDSTGRAVFDSPEGIEALEYMADQITKYRVAYLTTGYEHQNDFLAGRVAMVQGSSASLSYMAQQKIPFPMGIAPLPAGKRRAVVLSGTNVIMFRKPDRTAMDMAWRLVKYLIRTDNTARWSAQTSYLPLRRSALQHPDLARKFQQWPGLLQAYRQLDHAYPEPREVAWVTGRAIVEEEGLQPALKGVKSPAEALHHAARRINQQYGTAGQNPWPSMLLLVPAIAGLGLLAARAARKRDDEPETPRENK